MGKKIEIKSSDINQSINYWKCQLEDCSPVLNFPYDYPKIKNPSVCRGKELLGFSSELSSELRQISKNEGVSIFSSLLTTFGILMHKYSGDKDLNIVIPAANQTLTSMQATIGGIDNMVVIRLRFDDVISFKNLIITTNKCIAEANTHQDLAFREIVEIVNPEQNGNANPSFQVAFSFDHNLPFSQGLRDVDSNIVFNQESQAIFNITCELIDNGDIIKGELVYNPDLLDRNTIIRLRDNYINLVANLVSDFERPIASVPLISKEETKRVLGFTNTSTPYPSERTITQLFEEKVGMCSNKTAVVYKQESLSYEQLNRRSNQLARKLKGIGIERNNAVGLLVDKSIDLIVGILGILKSGGAYVPIDPEYPAERINFMIHDSNCKVILTQNKNLDLPFRGVDKICLNSSESYLPDEDNIVTQVTSNDLAYIIYTSGTTGKPKGSMIRHKSVVRLIRNTNYIDLTAHDRILLTGAIVFDAATFEIWGALLNGGSLIIPDKEEVLDPDLLEDLLTKHQITTLWLTSALFTQIAEVRTDIFKKLKYLLVGGDVLSPQHINKVRRDNPKLILINGYGPTENTTFTACYHIESDFDNNIPIGKPISNTTVYIFNPYLNLQPVGVIGEIFTGGDGLSVGYLNNDELSKASFIEHPFLPGEKLYRTGDYGKWLADGNIEFHGRIDNQIKIRGFRVEIDEIESAISGIEGIINTVVKPFRIAENDQRLAAFLNVNDKFRMESKAIKEFLKEKLPFYMVPSIIKIMHGFPLNVNGKIDRKVLVFNENEHVIEQNSETEPFNPTEQKIYEIWCEILNIKKINRHDNFFNIGGHSLIAMSAINKISELINKRISYKDFRTNPTIALLSKIADDNSLKNNESIDLLHLKNTDSLPLTQSQIRIWLTTRINPASVNYNLPFAYHLVGPLNIENFQKSLKTLLFRHHTLFSVIDEKNGEPYCSLNYTNVEAEIIDYCNIPLDERKSAVLEFINTDSRQGFDLVNGPLFRLFLFKLNSEEYYFYFNIHHIVFDGWSWKVFIDDLNQLYNDFLANKANSLKELPFQQYDFALYERNLGLSENNEKLIIYWKTLLEGCSSYLNFPYDNQRVKNSTGFGKRESIRFSSQVSSELRQISKHAGISLFSAMLTTFGILMHKYSGDLDINIGTPVANRSHSSAESLIGMFVNSIVIRMKFDQDISFNNLLKSTDEIILNSIEHQDLSFEKIVEIVNPERISNINPVFQVAFAWDDNLDIPLKLNEIKTNRVFIQGGVSTFDITCSMLDNGEEIAGDIEYNTDIINQDTIIRLRDNYINLVKNLISNFETPISSIPLILENEKKEVLGFTNTYAPYPGEKTITQLFEEQVIINPQKIAVVSGDDSLTYDWLNRKSNQLARRLTEDGIEKNAAVGLLVDKSIDLIVGILGILKAGGVYLPLDPESPAERINFMVGDAGCRAILTKYKYTELSVPGVKKIFLDAQSSYHVDDTIIANESDSEDLAYIMYTSGTTGKPKGSMIRHKSVVRLVRNTNYIELTSQDRILLTGAIVFDATTFEIWGALLNGATLYIIDKYIILDPDAFGEELLRNEISVLWLTSPLFTQIAEVRTDIFSKLKYLLVGGDVLSAPHINKVRKDNPQLKVINGYGPTENTTFSTTFLIGKDFEHTIPIGKPISNSKAYIFDKNMNYQPIGVIGEITVGGDGLSKGYLNREDLNKISFIDNPHKQGEKLYKTGDYGRWLPDGNIEFHGRLDNQIKIRGFRVELEEIESVLSKIEGVVETVVKPFKVQEGDIRLVAFLNVPVSFKMGTKEIEGLIKEKLPVYMIPVAYKFLNGFRKTLNGKTDRNALHFDINELERKETQDLESLTPTERKIYNIWCSTLKTSEISPNDNFFEIGGNSLLAVSVLSKIESEFKLGLSLRILFDYPRIRDISAFIDYSMNKLANPKSEEKKEGANSKIIKGSL